MNIAIDSRLKRFVKGTLIGENEDIISIYLTDINETFHFESEVEAQDFLNIQVRERFGDDEIKKGFFDFADERKCIHRYVINGLYRGKITSYYEEIKRR